MTLNLTDPANHPANGPLTVERIERVIEALKRSIDYQNGGDMAYVIADAIKGLEELLVSREAVNFRENVNSSTEHFREISETSTDCLKCGGRGSYHCQQVLGAVECECTLPAVEQDVK